jgi:hypothetical protein
MIWSSNPQGSRTRRLPWHEADDTSIDEVAAFAIISYLASSTTLIDGLGFYQSLIRDHRVSKLALSFPRTTFSWNLAF